MFHLLSIRRCSKYYLICESLKTCAAVIQIHLLDCKQILIASRDHLKVFQSLEFRTTSFFFRPFFRITQTIGHNNNMFYRVRDILNEIGCPVMQGWHKAQPGRFLGFMGFINLIVYYQSLTPTTSCFNVPYSFSVRTVLVQRETV